jgi:hypothetical protein
MNIKSSLVKVSREFGKVTDITTSTWKDAWTYITAALDGTWGTVTFDDGTVFYKGSVVSWQSSTFTATSSLKQLILPVASNESYIIWINNTVTGVVTCKLVGAGSYGVVVTALTSGHSYKIISSDFIAK